MFLGYVNEFGAGGIGPGEAAECGAPRGKIGVVVGFHVGIGVGVIGDGIQGRELEAKMNGLLLVVKMQAEDVKGNAEDDGAEDELQMEGIFRGQDTKVGIVSLGEGFASSDFLGGHIVAQQELGLSSLEFFGPGTVVFVRAVFKVEGGVHGSKGAIGSVGETSRRCLQQYP